MLTPIKTRGRRKPPSDPGNGRPRTVPSGPKGGRPMLAPEAKRASSQAGSNKRARLLVTEPPSPKPRKRLSRLESLPVELIEEIFLYSLNINLPRCSHLIAAAVSSERIYRALLLLAFFDNDVARFVMSDIDQSNLDEPFNSTDPISASKKTAEKEVSRLMKPLAYLPLWEDERRSLQAAIVSCRWCTMERLMSVLPDLMRLTIWQRWLSWAVNMPKDQQDSLQLFLAHMGDRLQTKGLDPIQFENSGGPNARHVLYIDPMVSISIRQEGNGSSHETKRDLPILGVLEIPDRFLNGGQEGFSETHGHFLEFLRVAGGLTHDRGPDFQKDINFSREAIQEGIHTALIEHSVGVLTTLLKLDEYTFRCQNNRHPLLYMLPSEHFRTAVRVARNDPSLFQLLLCASAESVPSDDSEITQWAIALNGPFGPWLLDLMLQLPERLKKAQLNPSKTLFVHGLARTWRDPMAWRYHCEVLGLVIPPEELEAPGEVSDDEP